MVIRKLILANLSSRKARAALTVAAIALSVSLVVSVTSGYASVEAAVNKYLNQYMGTVDVEIVRANDPSLGTSDALIAQIRGDPDVVRVDGRYETGGTLARADGTPSDSRVAIIGVRRPQDTRSDYLKMTAGGWFNRSDTNEAVIDQAVAESLNVGVGDVFLLPGDAQPLRLKVAGIVHKPAIIAQYMQTMYVPLETIQRFAGRPGAVSRIWVDLNRGVDPAAWARRWEPRAERLDANLKLRLARDTRQEMDRQLEGVHLLSYLGGTVSMLAATFIVFSALSMGVAERQRTLAMLRAVGAFRAQIGWLVIGEGVVLALLGAAIGVPLGAFWVKTLSYFFDAFFVAGVVISWGGIVFGVLGSVATALLASLLPAWSATRVDPLEAMAPLAAAPPSRPPLLAALAGLALVSIDPVLFFGPVETAVRTLGFSNPVEVTRAVKLYAHFGLGLPALFMGFFLVSPVLVWV